MNIFDQCTLGIAAKFAHSLPERIEITLFVAYCLAGKEHRRNITSGDQYFSYLISFMQGMKVDLEDAERAAGTDVHDDQVLSLLIYFRQRSHSSDLAALTSSVAQVISTRTIQSISPDEITSARTSFVNELEEWLDKHLIPRQRGTPIRLAESSVSNIVRNYEASSSLYLTPHIPNEKLTNAADHCRVSSQDTVMALIDCTFWGSANDAVIIGCRGIYHHQTDEFGFLPYSDLINHSILMNAPTSVSVGPDHIIDLNGSSFSVEQFINLLGELKKSALAKKRSASDSKRAGLRSVRGMSQVVEMLERDVVGPLKNKDKYMNYGLTIPNGVLLYGPPGCGKTYLARQLAEELGYNFQEVVPSTLASSYIHETVRKIGEIFATAAQHAPSMLFVDEFDAAVPSRESLSGDSDHKAEEVNEWLTQISNSAELGILFVAATNFPWKIDIAVLRSGRIDKKVFVGPPIGEAIYEILQFHLCGRPHSAEDEIRDFSQTLEGCGFSSSDIKLMVDEAARLAMAQDQPIQVAHLNAVIQTTVRPSIPSTLLAAYSDF